MSTTMRARTARKPHLCEGCHQSASLRGVATIAPGHRYLLHTTFPGNPDFETSKPLSVKECMSCLNARDDTAPLLLADACGTFCCGDVPCARPDRHDGDHSCRRCALACSGQRWAG